MYKKILIPTDGSEPAAYAVKKGIELAKALSSQVYGIYVIDVSAFTGYPTEAIWESMRKLMDKEAKQALGTIEKLASSANVKCETQIAEGVPFEEIIKAAKDKGAELIVMGTVGKRGFVNRFLLGSVTEKVVRAASCAVLVIRK